MRKTKLLSTLLLSATLGATAFGYEVARQFGLAGAK